MPRGGVRGTVSSNHPVVRLVRALATPHGRKKHGLVLLEGFRAAEGALAAGAQVRIALMTPAALASNAGDALANRLAAAGATVHTLAERAFRAVSLVESPPGVVLVCEPPRASLDRALQGGLLLVADRVSDPGNLGTMLRSAAAFGVDAVLATRGTTEAGNPKSLRASAGAWPGLSLVPGLEPRALADAIAAAGFRTLVADADGKSEFHEVSWCGRIALVVGSEAHGIDPVFTARGGETVRIPMRPRVESLNAAAAVAVLLAEADRQRRKAG